jgi:hypothetical protein
MIALLSRSNDMVAYSAQQLALSGLGGRFRCYAVAMHGPSQPAANPGGWGGGPGPDPTPPQRVRAPCFKRFKDLKSLFFIELTVFILNHKVIFTARGAPPSANYWGLETSLYFSPDFE